MNDTLAEAALKEVERLERYVDPHGNFDERESLFSTSAAHAMTALHPLLACVRSLIELRAGRETHDCAIPCAACRADEALRNFAGVRPLVEAKEKK